MKPQLLTVMVALGFLISLPLSSTLITVDASQPSMEAKVKGNSYLKLLEIAKTLQPGDKILTWIDINATVDHFGYYYLPADPSLYGIKWITITFAPDIKKSKLFWCLAEIHAQDVEKIIKIPWVFDMAMVRVGGLNSESSMNPKLYIGFQETINRATQHNGTLQVIIWMDFPDSERRGSINNGTKDKVICNVTGTIEQMQGRLLRDYYDGCHSLLAALPAKNIIEVTKNQFIKKLYLNGPVVPEGFDNTINLYGSGSTKDNINLHPFKIALSWTHNNSFVNFLYKYPFC